MDGPVDLSTLYQAHARAVWRTVARLGVDPADVEDVVHDVFVAAHHARDRFDRRSTPRTWLLGIAVRTAANVRRRHRPHDVLDDTLTWTGASPEERAEHLERLRQLDGVLSALPREQREVVVLIELEQMSAPDVALALGVKLNTVYSRLRLARIALDRALATQEAVHHD